MTAIPGHGPTTRNGKAFAYQAGIRARIESVEWFRYEGSNDPWHIHAGESGRPDALNFRIGLGDGLTQGSLFPIEYQPVGADPEWQPWQPTGYAGRARYDVDRSVGDDGEGYMFYPYKVTDLTPSGR